MVNETIAEMGDQRVRERSLESLYLRHIDWAESLAFLLTRDRHLAEDLAQEAFIRVAGRLHHLRHAEAFKAYFRQTLVNLCRAQFKRADMERTLLERSARSEMAAGKAESPEMEVTSRFVAALPPRQRAAIVMRYFEDLSEEQTATMLRCSKRAVNALISRAMKTLREELGGQADDER